MGSSQRLGVIAQYTHPLALLPGTWHSRQGMESESDPCALRGQGGLGACFGGFRVSENTELLCGRCRELLCLTK